MKTIMNKVVMGVLLFGLANTAFAGEKEKEFKKKHPRRAEVVGRANNEEKKNNTAAADGKITPAQQARLNNQDQKIKTEERADAAANGGHITKGEQRDMNRQENKVNRERNGMEKRDATKANAPVSGASAGTTAAPVAPAQPVTPSTTN